jgi:hypothetical protein
VKYGISNIQRIPFTLLVSRKSKARMPHNRCKPYLANHTAGSNTRLPAGHCDRGRWVTSPGLVRGRESGANRYQRILGNSVGGECSRRLNRNTADGAQQSWRLFYGVRNVILSSSRNGGHTLVPPKNQRVRSRIISKGSTECR